MAPLAPPIPTPMLSVLELSSLLQNMPNGFFLIATRKVSGFSLMFLCQCKQRYAVVEVHHPLGNDYLTALWDSNEVRSATESPSCNSTQPLERDN